MSHLGCKPEINWWHNCLNGFMIWYHLLLFLRSHFILSSVSILLYCYKHKEKRNHSHRNVRMRFFLFSLSYFTTTELLFKSQRTRNKKNGNQIEFMSNHWTHKKRKEREHFSLHTNSIDFQRHYLFYSSFTKIILFFLHEFYKNQHHNSDSSIFGKYHFYSILFSAFSFRW